MLEGLISDCNRQVAVIQRWPLGQVWLYFHFLRTIYEKRGPVSNLESWDEIRFCDFRPDGFLQLSELVGHHEPHAPEENKNIDINFK